MPVTSADLARYTKAVSYFFGDTAIVARTGATVKCRFITVPGHQRMVRLGSVMQYLRLRQWQILIPLGTNVVVGDVLTKGTVQYRVLDVLSVGDYDVAITLYAALAQASGDILVTDTVTFQQAGTGATTVAMPVGISPATTQEQVMLTGTADTHVVIYDDTVTFPNGAHIGLKDILLWVGLPNGFTELHFPQRFTPISVGMAYFDVVG